VNRCYWCHEPVNAAGMLTPQWLAILCGRDGSRYGFTAYAHFKCSRVMERERTGDLGEKHERAE
jgi:hypothetical protein